MSRSASDLRSQALPFGIVLTAGFMALLDVSIVNVALPSMESSLGAGPAEVQWIVAGYALTFGLSLVAAGKAGDLFGRRRLFMIGVMGFVLASAGCGFSPTPELLIVMRLLQGLFSGILNPQVLGLMQDMFAGQARARAFGVFGVVVGLSTAIGPALGGALIGLAGSAYGWRLVFLINLPIGLVVLPLAAKYLPRSKRVSGAENAAAREFDPVGVLLVGLTVVLVMLPFLASSGEGGPAEVNPAVYWLVAAAVVAAILTWAWEKLQASRGREVLLDPVLMKDRSFVLGLTTAFFYFAGFTSIFIITTLYLQQELGWTAFQAGAAVIPFAVTSGAASGVSGRLVNRFGRLVPLFGAELFVVAMLGMGAAALLVEGSGQPFLILALLTVSGAGSGLLIAPNQALTLEAVPAASAGIAAALLQTFQRLGAAIGLSAVTTVYFQALRLPAADVNPALPLGFAVIVVAGITFFSLLATLADWLRRRGGTRRTVASALGGKTGRDESLEEAPVED